MPRATKRRADDDDDALAVTTTRRVKPRAGASLVDARDAPLASGALRLRRDRRDAREAPRTSALSAPIMALEGGHRAAISGVCFSRDGARLYSCGVDETAQRWIVGEASARANDCAMTGAKAALTGACVMMSDEVVVTSDAGGIVRAWDAETGTQVKSYASTRGTCANDVAAGRGTMVMSASDDGRACVWDLRVKKAAAKTYAHAVPQTAVVMSADGERAYTGGVDEVVRVWDARADDRPLMTLKGHTDTITGLALSPCGSYVLSNAMDNTLRMWDTRAFVEGEREVKSFVGHSHNFEKALLRCAFNSDGTRVCSGSSDSCVYVWEVEDAKLKYKLPGHKGTVAAVAFSPAENSVIASGGAEGVIYVGELDR